jgi:lipooligosaccharide transport system ATP-binding protein
VSYIIRAENLAKSYGDVKALKGISFTVEKGQCFGFLGHNGAGKSTTMRMLYGLSIVDDGALWLFGEEVSLTPPRLKRLLGIVPQEDNLDTDLSVIENLIVYGGYFGLSRAEALRRGTELLEFMGLQGKEAANVEELSGGLKRRLVIARALINRPEIIILDEPTTGLDPEARRLVWQKLRWLKEEGATLVLTTHYMEEAAQLCDRLVIMNEGKILAEGSPENLVAEHVLPYVIEVRVPLDRVPPDLAARVKDFGGEIAYLADEVFVFVNDGESLWRRLDDLGLPQHSCYLRKTNLEDVYLKLTGRGDEA